MNNKVLKKVISCALAVTMLGGSAAVVLPVVGVDTGIEASAESGVSFWYRNNGDGTATVTGCEGSGDIVIPSQIDVYTVTAIKSENNNNISDNNFKNTSIRSVVIPSTVKTIDAGTFDGNTGLRSVTLNEGLETIGEKAFYGCTSLKEINIPSTTRTIGESAFESCVLLEKAVIGDNVTEIGGSAFYKCTRLKDLTIGDSVQKIGGGAFAGCTSLEKVVIPDSVLSMGFCTFSGCTSLKTVKLGEGLSTIPRWCFSSTALTDLPEMQYISVIDQSAFANCDNLTGFVLPDCVTRVEARAFDFCDNLKWVVVPDVTSWDGLQPFGNAKIYSFTNSDCTLVTNSDFITLNKTNLTMRNGTSTTLTASVSSTFYTDRTVKWKSSNNSVVSVSGGKLTAKKTGKAVITAETVNGIQAKCTVTVKADPTSIKLNKTSTTIEPRKTETLKVTLGPSNAYDILTWTSSNTKVAAISNGKITAKAVGKAIITAKTINGKTAKCTVYVKKNVSNMKATLSTTTYKYNGSARTPSVTLKDGSKKLVKGTDYTVTYKNNKAIGTATVTIKGKGNYYGTLKKTFKIVPKTVTIKTVTSPKPYQLKVTWKADKSASGYQITYSEYKDFGYATNKTISKNSTTSATFKNLWSGKHYVKIRAYKTVNGKKVYGSYSSVKSTSVKYNNYYY